MKPSDDLMTLAVERKAPRPIAYRMAIYRAFPSSGAFIERNNAVPVAAGEPTQLPL
ncbi:MAG: hypothetical protein QHI48_02780 [Bacteroidota bacterium]|nr:hypothetical protein [Bacteroidota bacterium]